MNPNYCNNTIEIENRVYDLDEVRKFLLKNYEPLCTNHFIKCITVLGRRTFTYDWMAIIEIAEQGGYLSEFHKHNEN